MFEAFILGLVQGLTEFLPVSSSGHIIIVELLLGVKNSRGFAAAIHIGTCIAAIIYFHKDIISITNGLINWKNDKFRNEKNLGINIIIATIPAVILGFIVRKIGIDEYFSSSFAIGLSAIIFALLLYFADKHAVGGRKLGITEALIIGGSQIIAAIFPGSSRSGVTLTTSFLLNLEKEFATKFIFLISIPITALASINEIIIEKSVQFNSEFIIAFTTALISGIFAIHFLLYFIKTKSLKWLVFYRIIFGIIAILI